jgi:hypothetical protein
MAPNGPRKKTARPRSEDTSAYDVGYGRPPREHQFKEGKSGNPNGRPKGRKNHATIVGEILHRKLSIRDRGRNRTVPLIEAMLLKFAEEALRGNPKAAAFLLNRYGAVDEESAADRELSADDQDILDAFAQRIRNELKDDEK